MKRVLPAYPLFLKDPNFSIWSVDEELNKKNVQTWFGEEKKIYGFFKTNKKTFCFMGNYKDFSCCNILPCEQKEVKVSLFSTDYTFLCGKKELKISFVSPLPLDDLNLLSLPVTYIEYEFEGEGEISLFVNRNVGYNKYNIYNSSRAISFPQKNYELACIGLKRQLALSNNDDVVGADWGYYYLSGEKAIPLDEKSLCSYLTCGNKEFTVQDKEVYISSINNKNKSKIMFGYDEGVSIDYFGKYYKGYYLQNKTILDGFEYIYKNFTKIKNQLNVFEKELKKKAIVFGNEYYYILVASYRQSIAGHKLIKDENGEILFLSKECGSNGCVGTVDVSYPSMPLYLLYNTELVKGMMRPIFKFAKMPIWKYDFAPHDVGTYPHCSGQVYGLDTSKTHFHGNFYRDDGFQTHLPLYLLPKEFDAYLLEKQMPVEECADMLIMLYACYIKDQDISLFKSEIKLCDKWVKYLIKYGLKPENQLCTDDFAGHLKNNLNLAIKSSVAIACYGNLLKLSKMDGEKYLDTAKNFASKIEAFGEKFTHLPLTWDSDDSTYSLKYNLAMDKLLKLNLFSEKTYKKEVDCYVKNLNKYGVPLDNRKDYVKSDWLIWVSYFAKGKDKISLINTVCEFLTNSPDRIPFSDWYDSKDGKTHPFRARTVQGGCFILLI